MKYILLATILAVVFGTYLNSQEQPTRQCQPAEVNWKFQGVPVRSFGCISIQGDTVFIIANFLGGVPKDGVKVGKDQVDNILVYVPSKLFKTSKS